MESEDGIMKLQNLEPLGCLILFAFIGLAILLAMLQIFKTAGG